jgi:hypothetical protein
LAGLLDGDGLGGLAGLGSDLLNVLDNVKALDDLAEYNVLAVEPRGLDGANEELGAVAEPFVSVAKIKLAGFNLRSGTSVGHREDTGASVLQVEVLVLKLLAIDGLTTSALSIV